MSERQIQNPKRDEAEEALSIAGIVSMQRKEAASLTLRLVIVFVLALGLIILALYYYIAGNFQKLLTDYTITMVDVVVEQGVSLVESELSQGREEIGFLAGEFQPPQESTFDPALLPVLGSEETYLRTLYVTRDATISSDGRQLDLRQESDILAAFSGKLNIKGPYYNAENEFVVRYSAPVCDDNGDVLGVLCLEKDGYLFSQLIANIHFEETGEAYIINAEGTGIAVSDMERMDWVTSKHSARQTMNETGSAADNELLSILQAESKVLEGQSGMDTYYHNGELCYIIYAPISSEGWGLICTLRDEDLAAMTQTIIFASLTKGSALPLLLMVFCLLTGLMGYWIFSSVKKAEAINRKLEFIAKNDPLTGLLNRRFLETELTDHWKYPVNIVGQAAVFMIDVDDFKKYNDFYGHQKGDDCLRTVASILKNAFANHDGYVIRYGGEEFMAVAFTMDHRQARQKGAELCHLVEAEGLPNHDGGVVTISIGVCHVNMTPDHSLYACIKAADKALYQAKSEGKNRSVVLSPVSGTDDPSAEGTFSAPTATGN